MAELEAGPLHHTLYAVEREVHLHGRIIRNLAALRVAAEHAGNKQAIMGGMPAAAESSDLRLRGIDCLPVGQIAHGNCIHLDGRSESLATPSTARAGTDLPKTWRKLSSFRHTCRRCRFTWV